MTGHSLGPPGTRSAGFFMAKVLLLGGGAQHAAAAQGVG